MAPSKWNLFVKKIYHEGKRSNPNYEFKNALKDEEQWAVKLSFEYFYGKPKQVIDQNNTHTTIDFDVTKLYDKEA